MDPETKQEGEFKIKTKKSTPRQLNPNEEVTKVDLSIKKEVADITKVVIPTEPIVVVEDVVVDEIIDTTVVIKEITKEDELVLDKVKVIEKQIIDLDAQGRKLPDNIEKLVSFMEDTGGSIEDYIRLNTDYSTVNEEALLKEYYKKTKPYLNKEEIEFTIQDSFYFDEELEEERDIKKKKLAFKEEIEKAKVFLNEVKTKYYDEVKIKSTVSAEKNEAVDFFNRYKEDQTKVRSRQDEFKSNTSKFFNEDFKGFDFNLGEKKFRYGITNNQQVSDSQSDISNFVGKFLDNEGKVTDTAGYHKALYTAMNSDKIAQHFYEQGKADAVKDVISSSKNPSVSQPRQVSSNVFVNGLKVKSVSGFDSSKLKIKTKKFN